MLVLSRKSSQQIMIGPDIQITIVKIDRNQVRIGIQAPAGVPILRQELAGVPRAATAAPAPAGRRGRYRSGIGGARASMIDRGPRPDRSVRPVFRPIGGVGLSERHAWRGRPFVPGEVIPCLVDPGESGLHRDHSRSFVPGELILSVVEHRGPGAHDERVQAVIDLRGLGRERLLGALEDQRDLAPDRSCRRRSRPSPPCCPPPASCPCR